MEKIFKALGCETRLWMVWLLSKRPLCVCEIMGILDIPQAKASRHLAYLKNAGILDSRRQEQWVVYSIKEDLEESVRKIVNTAVEVMEGLPEAYRYKKKLEEIISDSSYRLKHGFLESTDKEVNHG